MERPIRHQHSIRIAAAAAITATIASLNEAPAFAKIPSGVFLILAVALGFVLSHFVELLVSCLFSSTALIRKLLLLQDDIEGYWADIITIEDMTCVGILYFQYSNNGYKVTGWQYDPNGIERLSWESIVVTCDGEKLEYLYKVDYHNTETTKYGYSSITLCRKYPTKRPTALMGNFLDLGQGSTKITFQATRLDNTFVDTFHRDAQHAVQEYIANEINPKAEDRDKASNV